MDPGREFLLKRGYAPKLRAKIAKGRRAVMPGVTAMDDSAGVMSPLKQIIHFFFRHCLHARRFVIRN